MLILLRLLNLMNEILQVCAVETKVIGIANKKTKSALMAKTGKIVVLKRW